MSEKTLGEEIQELTTRGIDTSTVEKMYSKYTELTADSDSKVVNDKRSSKSEPKLRKVQEILFSRLEKLDEGSKIGDKTTIKLDGLGEFTATVHNVTNDKIVLIFDDYVTKRPMNESDTNQGGFEESDLNKWLHNEFINVLPDSIRGRLTNVTIPTVGEMFGWDDEWDKNNLEADNDKQLSLMKQRHNRAAYYNNECGFGWLRNAAKKVFSSIAFASVFVGDYTYCSVASDSIGVRPEIWLTK